MSDVFDHLGAALGRADRLGPRLMPARAERAARVFLSRSRWRHEVRIANEAELEEMFRARGFAVVHPQDLPPHELVQTLQAAAVVAASDGTHAHLAAFCGPGTGMLLLDTRPVPTQVAIARMRGLRALHLPVYINPEGIWNEETRRLDPGPLGAFVDLALETRLL
jgi:capsular polysaccharide biosynthesis protein